MKRSGPIKRSTSLRSSGGPRTRVWIKPRNAKRKAKEFARAYGSPERVRFVKGLPCLVWNSACAGEIENAHIVTGGMGRKADAATIVPLCAFHHGVLHRVGVDSFECHQAVNLTREAERVERLWQRHLAGPQSLEPLSSIVPRVVAAVERKEAS